MTTANDSGIAAVRARWGAGGPAEAALIGWRRAQAFNLLNRGARWPGGALFAPWLWPTETLPVAVKWGHVRRLGGASMTLDDGTPPRLSRPVLVVAGLLLIAQFVLSLVVAVLLSLALSLSGLLSPGWAAAAGFLAVGGPLLIEMGVRLVRLLLTPQARSLMARRAELAAGGAPVYVMTSFVRSRRPGDGARLLAALQQEWQHDGAAVLLHPANQSVADYYARHGAQLDGDRGRLMRFDYRPTVSA